MCALRHGRATQVWVVLIAATLVSWWLGADFGAGDSRRASAIIILGVACVKIRLVGVHFMALRTAPRPLRAAFDGYVVTLFLVLCTLYLAA